MLVKLLELLPTLALLGLGLNGLESVQTAAAVHQPAHRSPEHHRHLAARQKLENGVSKKGRGLIRRGADGSVCRVRGSNFAPSGSASAVASASASTSTSTSSAAPASSVAAAVAVASSAASSAAAPPASSDWSQPAASSAWSAPASSAAPAAPAASSNTPSYSGSANGGWANTGSKLGQAWPNGNWAGAGSPDYIGNYIGSKTSWYYTWSPFSVGSGDSLGLEFVPMLWGPHQVSDWWGQQGSWPNTVKNALFFNEPNEGSQCNMAAGDSVSYWMNDFLPLRSKGIKLGGAATTSAPSGLQWILDFEKLCVQYGNSQADCTMDFLPLHWYDVSASNFQQYVQNFHDKTGHDIWITEYSCQNFNGGAQCSESETWALHQQMAAWFDATDYVKRYAPFGAMKNMQGVNQFNALMNPDGSITALGSWYISSA